MNEEAERGSGLGMKLIAGVVLLIAAWVLFTLVLGFLKSIAWVFLVIGAIVAVVWALRVL